MQHTRLGQRGPRVWTFGPDDHRGFNLSPENLDGYLVQLEALRPLTIPPELLSEDGTQVVAPDASGDAAPTEGVEGETGFE